MSAVVTEGRSITRGGVRWEAPPEHHELLFDGNGLRLAEWLRDGRATVVKQGPHRTVHRVELDGLAFHVKHYPVADLRGWLRQLVRPSKARTEHDRALALTARGLPTFVPLAVGERRGGLGPGDSYLLTLSLEGTEPLNTFIEETLPRLAPARRTRLRQLLAVELGGLVARMHEAGVVHHDLHAANLLLRLDEDDRPHLYLIDLSAVRVGGPLDWRASRDNLVVLNRWFTLRCGRADRLRFWHTYFAGRGRAVRRSWAASVLGPGPAAQPDRLTRAVVAADLERRTWESNLGFWRHRDRRCLGSNRYYRRVRTAAVSGHAVTDLDRAELAELSADPDEPFRRPGVKLLKDSRSSTVAELEMTVGGVARRVIYKRFRVTAWTDPWANLVRRSPALRSWVHGHGLRERCLPTARPLAVLSRRRHGLAYEGYLLTEKLEGAADLHDFLAGLSALPRRDRQNVLRGRIDQVARLVRELHRRHLSHRDLKAANVLISAGPERRQGPAQGGAWFIDLVGVELFRRLLYARRMQNLTRLNASFHHSAALTRTDRLRFLRVYLEWGLRGRGGWKTWWRDIERATLAKARRNQRSGRPLC
jgi:tRNA A-37 threonylcarbamoyl transferase component Bud32